MYVAEHVRENPRRFSQDLTAAEKKDGERTS